MNSIEKMKAAAKEGWSTFAPFESFTGSAAPHLVRFAGINRGDRVLDVGSGPGFVAQRIREEIEVEVRCLDVVDLNKTNYTVTLFDGENIPFEDDAFSVTLGLFMLHHARESAHLKVLSEMKRVTS